MQRCRPFAAALAGLLTAGLAGCRVEGDEDVAGPCIHQYVEPVLRVESARSDDSAGTPVSRVALSDFSVDGRRLNAAELWPRENAVERDDQLVCDIPCAFGHQEGLWQFTARAEGHAPKSVQAEARYAVFVGGCPSYNDEGTSLSLLLQRSG